MPANAQIMAVPDSISVSETGGAIQNFPIAVPPGTAGVVPSLSLTYNSQGSNGIVGMGFMLNGLATIGRCAQTRATDGQIDGVSFDVNDRFCLDGQRLIAVSGTYGADGTEYRTEIESFSKVVSRGAAGTGPAWFEVRTKSGQVMEFGNSADSRILATGKPEARSWAVNKVADTAGNYFTISYVNDTANGQAYPSRIDYTGNSAAALAPYNSVRFVYSTNRADVMTAYLAGSLIRTTALLTNIQTYAGNGVVSDYRFTYNSVPATNRMRLRTVTLCEGGGTCLPATTIGWTSGGDLNNGFAKSTIPAAESIPNFYQVYGSGDFNGDGLTDLYLNSSRADGRSNGPGVGGPPQVWLSKGDGSFNRLTLPDAENVPRDYQVYSSGDFNGDGLTDLYVNPAREDGRRARGPGNGLPPQVWLSKGDGSFNRLTLPDTENMPQDYLVYSSGDFNGDGLTDLYLNISRESGQAEQSTASTLPQVWLSKGDGTFIRNQLPIADGMQLFYRVFGSGDFNGDGLTDLHLQVSRVDGRTVASTATALPQVWLSKGDGTFIRSVLPIADSMPGDYQVYGVGDFNGDGLTDLYLNISLDNGTAGQSTASTLPQVWLSKGDGTFIRNQLPIADGMQLNYRVFGSGDFNGDGLTDLYLHLSRVDGRTVVSTAAALPQVWLSKGDGTFIRNVLPIADSMPGDYRVYGSGDFNGDGLTDIYSHFSHPDGRAAGTPNYNLAAEVRTSPGPVPDILSSVASGLGELTSITYRPMTDSTVYTKDRGANAASYPVVDVVAPMQVTSRIEQSDGIGGVRASTYRYAGAKADTTGRGLLGFREMTARDEQTGIEQHSAYEQLYPFTLMKKSERRLHNGAVLSSVVNSYDAQNLGGTRRRVFLTQSAATGADLNGAPLPSSATTYQYDAYSNATGITVTASDGFSKTTTNTYLNDINNWLLGRLLTANVTSQAPNVADQAPAADTTPDAFDFTDITDASPSTVYEVSVNLTGFNRAVTASVSGAGAQIRQNGTGSWVASLTIAPGDRLNLRMTSSSAHGAAVTATVTVGGVSANWIVSTSRAIIISSNVNSFNLRAAHDALYPAPTGTESPRISVIAVVQPGVIVGSANSATPAFDVGNWPAGIPITMHVRGRIQGAGGDGGNMTSAGGAASAGRPGGLALYARFPITMILNDDVTGEIWGGGGGGGGPNSVSGGGNAGGGGGGAGQLPGKGGTGSGGGNFGAAGTTEAGGNGNVTGRAGGNGGGPGLPGSSAAGPSPGPGGAAGTAIDGLSFITKIGTGNIRGAQVN